MEGMDSVETLKSKDYFGPKKEIHSPQDMIKWEKSEAYAEYMGFVLMMNEAVKGKKMSTPVNTSNVTENMLSLLIKLDKWVDEIPPIDQPQRFGNKAFRNWFTKLQENSSSLLKEVLPEQFHPAIIELQCYLVESVGNYTRIDYGTGHEMSFVMLLCCMFKIGAFNSDDTLAVGLKIFPRYLELMRKIQINYRMEPAGSHGAWSLDDFQFLPFVWGSSQLIDHPKLLPKSFPQEEIAAAFHKDYMFLGAIQFIHKVKTGPFGEHSNQLWNISGVQSWSKVNGGLIKMYKVEVLSKFPLIQHTFFGSILSIKPLTQTP
ncbi:hypothetical protein CHUAL_006106 [Chamberlinius hualienensis]